MAPGRTPSLAVALAALVALAGCAGKEPEVYVSGYAWNGTTEVAMLWKDGEPIALSDGVVWAVALAVALSGEDVYVAGASVDGTYIAPFVWKNGVPQTLEHGLFGGFAEAIAVDGGTVYVAGAVNGAPVVWRDGAVTPLSGQGFGGRGEATGVAVAGGEVYVAGWEYVTFPVQGGFEVRSRAIFWKDGVAHPLTGAGVDAIATAIAVSGGDVYVAGIKGAEAFPASQRAMLWKNGEELALTDGFFAAAAYALTVQGGDVVTGGVEDFLGLAVPKVWRNGAPMDLSLRKDGAVVRGIALNGMDVHALDGGDIHAVGREGLTAVYWKNGTQQALTDGRYDATATGIALRVR